MNPISCLKFLRLFPAIFTVDKNVWDSALTLESTISDHRNVSDSLEIWDQNRYSSLINQPPKGQSFSSNTHSQEHSAFVWKGQRIPFVSGLTTVEQTLACLDMVCKYYNAPFRRDIVERAANQAIKSTNVSLEILGNLSTYMGLLEPLVIFPWPNAFALPSQQSLFITNSLVLFLIFHDIVRASLPTHGRVSIPLKQFTNEADGLRVFAFG